LDISSRDFRALREVSPGRSPRRDPKKSRRLSVRHVAEPKVA